MLKDPKNLQLAMAMCPEPRLKEALAAFLGLPTTDQEDDEDRVTASAPKREEKKPEVPKVEKSLTEQEADKWKDKGNALYKEKRFEEALEAYDKAIELNGNDITYLNNKAGTFALASSILFHFDYRSFSL